LRTSDLREKIKSAKVLCVGAGGIGCELLKTLVCTGFQNIEVIDLDTIETSNLNRQFLFRKHHVGQSKAQTAAEVVRSFKPAANILAHHANIKEARFNVDFFKGFDIVLNGLDNLEARRHVNRLCMAAQRPLIESGTAGYVGQVTVHLKGVTECFECQPKPVPKSFPICTLRNTPDRPIHCIVWSKDMLFNRLFGKPDEVTDLDEVSKESGEAQEGQSAENAAATAAAAAAEELSFFVRKEGEGAVDYAVRVFNRVYTSDIERLVKMEELWKKRPPPKPLALSDLVPDVHSEIGAAVKAAKTGMSAARALGLSNTNQKWDARDSARVLLASIVMYLEHRPSEVGSSAFDKDDDLAVDFVTAASNLRSICYDIPTQSWFDAKGMAGNIIHAIATTNAIISGLIVTEAMKVLAGAQSACRDIYLGASSASSKRFIAAVAPSQPVKGCMACGHAQLTLHLNTNTMTLGNLISQVLKKALAVSVPMLQCGDFLYEEGEGLEEDEVEMYAAMLPRPLSGLPDGGLKHGSILAVTDELQHFKINLIIAHQDEFDEEKVPEGFILEGTVSQPTEAAAAAAEAPSTSRPEAQQAGVVADEDYLVLVDDEPVAAPAVVQAGTGKRKRSAEEEDGGGEGAKKAKAMGEDDEVIVL